MERDIWLVIVAALRRLPRRCSAGQRYTNRDVVAVLLWAALHDALNPAPGDPDFLGPMFPIYDGNGNVVKMIRFEDLGSSFETRESASYEYGPFGENRSTTGELGSPGTGGTHQGQRNPFRWSTKYTDAETGLVYYGYRYYSPSMGRWVNRDPIEEQGGSNLMAFVGNGPIGAVDSLGLWKDQKYTRLVDSPRFQFRRTIIPSADDSIWTAAQYTGLDHRDANKWLRKAKTKTFVALGDSIDACAKYDVPNIAHVGKGNLDLEWWGPIPKVTSWPSLQIGAEHRFLEYKRWAQRKEYFVFEDRSMTLADMQSAFRNADTYGLFIVAHGGASLTLGGGMVVAADKNGAMPSDFQNHHHRLGDLFLYACFAGKTEYETPQQYREGPIHSSKMLQRWRQLVSWHGKLHASNKELHPIWEWNDSVPWWKGE